MNTSPIFYDATGRRRRRFAVAAIAFAVLLLLSLGIFATSITAVSSQADLPFEVERPPISDVGQLAHAAKGKIRRAFKAAIWWSPSKTAATAPLAISFYVPWDDASAASLTRHIDDLDWLIPGWLFVNGPGHQLTVANDPRGQQIIAKAAHRPKLLPMIQNARDGVWDGAGTAALLRDPGARKILLDKIERYLLANNGDGIMFDFEDLPPSSQTDYLRFLHETRTRFASHRWLITLAVPVANPDWNLKAFASVADRIFLMAYDEHYPGGDPGPIASQSWFVSSIANALRGVPRDKAVVAVGSYGYDWTEGGPTDSISVEQGLLTAHESGVMPSFDQGSGNLGFAYAEAGKRHDVWLLDAASVHNQMMAAHGAGVNAIALWRLGTEDPSVWQVFGRHHRTPPDGRAIEHIPAGTDVDIEGSGEVLKVGSVPVPGLRQVRLDQHGIIADERFVQLPLPYAIQRAGYRPGLVALTFDDGPDPIWTPKILDVLKTRHVPATFFIIGENALTERGLLERMIAEGHEIGNHTYTHPNLGEATPRQTELELNATQRLFQAFTGRSMRLFRAPYFGDAEPTTADEINPVMTAQNLGYLSVGLHVDPGDWKRPGVQAIIDGTISGVLTSSEDRSGQVVLLHDSGGDRSQTVAALPTIIDALRQHGYRFVPVSTLINLQPADVMPTLSADDRAAANADLAMFTTLGGIVIALHWLFAVAISLGIARAVILSGLALWQRRKEMGQPTPPIDPSSLVSVLIPAFNEARVIESSVRRVLASEQTQLEVIVIDDGSVDGTGDIVERAFATDARVRLLRLPNGGKAHALNRGLRLARGELIIALDADTQFEPTTIARLARWFVDPQLGAVAGNAKVGNRVNLVTRWQALEYVTAQNLERRALARLDAITVVPGAVGAWRASTLREVGGFPHDTLAEDQDLTIAIQREVWRVRYDQSAVAWTEAPESFQALAKQRFRWAFGTLQCLWKHRAILRRGKPKGLARIGLPQAILFQIGFAAISPVIDLALIVSILTTALAIQAHGWAQTQTDIETMLTYWLVFMVIDLLAGIIAFALESREKWRLLWLLIPQRIGYRQIMYYVVVKAIVQALRGPRVGWGKLERSGRVDAV